MWMTLIFNGTAALFLAMTIDLLQQLRWVRRLPALDTFAATENRVRCSVVIAARDEAARIDKRFVACSRNAGVELEILIVEDRSADGTGDILRRLAKEDARLQVRRVDALPGSWLGKCHACHVGASAASGDWILFTDADC